MNEEQERIFTELQAQVEAQRMLIGTLWANFFSNLTKSPAADLAKFRNDLLVAADRPTDTAWDEKVKHLVLRELERQLDGIASQLRT